MEGKTHRVFGVRKKKKKKKKPCTDNLLFLNLAAGYID